MKTLRILFIKIIKILIIIIVIKKNTIDLSEDYASSLLHVATSLILRCVDWAQTNNPEIMCSRPARVMM